MLNDFTGADKVYIACGYTDLRKGIDGLARLVQQQFELDPFTNTLFLFCGRRRDRIKGLYWEKDSFILLYKRLEQGAYQWPRSESEVKTLPETASYVFFYAIFNLRNLLYIIGFWDTRCRRKRRTFPR